MIIHTLAIKEVLHRKLNFLLSVVAVCVSATTFLLAIALLKSTDLKTESILADKAEETGQSMARLEDEIRKSMKGLGFNIYIFPEGQDLGEVYDKGYASKTMPEEYVDRLAKSSVVTVNHLLPTLTQKITWPEYKRTIILIGVRGEVPIAHSNPMKPLIDPVEKGHIVLGSELARSMNVSVGSGVKLMGRAFAVSKCHPERGSKDDITVWINLAEAQELLDKRGLINEIQALECNCATFDRLSEIRRELLAILPGTQIIEVGSTALARAEARVQAGETARQQIETIKNQRNELKARRESLAAVLVPLVGIMGLAIVCLMTFVNVRERIREMGLFLAVGIQPFKLVMLFQMKAVWIGLTGGLLGLPLAIMLMAVFRESFFHGYGAGELLNGLPVVVILVVMPLFAAVAAWIPSFWAAHLDPAEVLRND